MAEPSGPTRARLVDKMRANPQLMIFVLAAALLAMAQPMFDSPFNNYLEDTFRMGEAERGALETPREAPGLLVSLSLGLLAFLPEARVGVVATGIMAAGLMGLGFLGTERWAMYLFLIIQSTGMHLFMPIRSSLALALSPEGRKGQRQGQIGAVGAVAGIAGSLAVFALWRGAHLTYGQVFIAAGSIAALGTVALALLHPAVGSRRRPRLIVRRRYWLYYMLTVLYGARKQVFVTFGPWVLIRVYGQRPDVFAWLYLANFVLAIFINPWVGRLVDRLGERRVLMSEAVVLALVSAGYGFGDHLGLGGHVIWLLYACFVADQSIQAVGMARNTYLDKISELPEHVPSTISVGMSIDHVFSMLAAWAGGEYWHSRGRSGYRGVFVGSMLLAGVLYLCTSLIRIPPRAATPEPAAGGPPDVTVADP